MLTRLARASGGDQPGCRPPPLLGWAPPRRASARAAALFPCLPCVPWA